MSPAFKLPLGWARALSGLIKYILEVREVVGEGALFTAGGVVFFQEGKQAGPYGQRVRSNDDTEFVATCIRPRYVSSSYAVILVQLLFRVIQG